MTGKVTPQEIKEIKSILNPPKINYLTLDGFIDDPDKRVKTQLGFIPTSIWKINWQETKKLKKFCRDNRSALARLPYGRRFPVACYRVLQFCLTRQVDFFSQPDLRWHCRL